MNREELERLEPLMNNRSLGEKLVDSMPGQILQKGIYTALGTFGAYIAFKGFDIGALTAAADYAKHQADAVNPFVRFLGELTLNWREIHEQLPLIIRNRFDEEHFRTGYIIGPAIAVSGASIYGFARVLDKLRKSRKQKRILEKHIRKI